MAHLLDQSIFSDLKAQGANEQQILEMLGVKAHSKEPAQQKPTTKSEGGAEEKELVLSAQALEVLGSVRGGNKEVLLQQDEMEVLKRDDYHLSDFAKFPSGICSFLGRKNENALDEQHGFHPERVRLNDASLSSEPAPHSYAPPTPPGDETVITSIRFHHAAVSLARKALPKLPPTRDESHLSVGENGLGLITNRSFAPHLFEWKRNEVIGVAEGISGPDASPRSWPAAAVADEQGERVYLLTAHPHSHTLTLVEWPLHMSSAPRHFALYAFDAQANYNYEDDASFYSPARRERVRSEPSREYAVAHEVRLSGSWVAVVVYPSQPLVASPSAPPPPLQLFFIDRTSLPPPPSDVILPPHVNAPQSTGEVNAYKVQIEVQSAVNDVTLAWNDGGGSNVCVTVTCAGQSFRRFERIERIDKLRSANGARVASPLNRSLSASIANSRSPSQQQAKLAQVIGFPCTDQNADSEPISPHQYFLDPRNPPSFQISRDLPLRQSHKGTIGSIPRLVHERDQQIFLAQGSWPELDIFRTINPMLPPSTRKFAALFTDDKSYSFPDAAYVSGATYLPMDEKLLDGSFSFPPQSSFGYIIAAVVTVEDGKVVEEIEIFDSRDFERGPAFVIRSKSAEFRFGFGISNPLGVWGPVFDL